MALVTTSIPSAQIFLMPFCTRKKQVYLDKWLILGLKKEIY